MEKTIYTKIKHNWQYLHPVNKFLTSVDYAIEKIFRKIRKTLHARQRVFNAWKGLDI